MTICLWVAIKTTQTIPHRPQEGKVFFYSCPLPVFFPGQVKGCGLQRLAASLIKLEEKIPLAVLLWDWKQEAFTEHAEVSGGEMLPNRKGNSALERGRTAAKAEVLSPRITAPCAEPANRPRSRGFASKGTPTKLQLASTKAKESRL